jgi:hypothetical protein
MTDTHIQQLQQLVAEWERTELPALRALLDESTHTGEER